MAQTQSHNSTHKRISLSHGKMNQIRGKASKQGMPVDPALSPYPWYATNTSTTCCQIYNWKDEEGMFVISGFNHSRCTSVVAASYFLHPVVSTKNQCEQKQGSWSIICTVWIRCGLMLPESSLSKLTFSCHSRSLQTGAADTLSWGCRVTAVLTEAKIWLARRGWLLWVRTLLPVSAFSHYLGAKQSKEQNALKLQKHQNPWINAKTVTCPSCSQAALPDLV